MCHSCQENSEKCASCNPYFILENGECLFIYSFEAIYKTSQANDFNQITKLFNVEYLEDYKINKIQVDDEYINPTSNYYQFNTDGDHTVRINIDLKESTSLNKFFENINELISINFTDVFNTTNIKNMSEMFSSSKNLIYINLSNLNTENVTDMSNMFKDCEKLNEIDISNFKTENVENMYGMFENTDITSLDLSHLETKNVKNMGNMFKDCVFLNFLKLNFNTENVENMSNMFSTCKSLDCLNITMFDTRKC